MQLRTEMKALKRVVIPNLKPHFTTRCALGADLGVEMTEFETGKGD